MSLKSFKITSIFLCVCILTAIIISGNASYGYAGKTSGVSGGTSSGTSSGVSGGGGTVLPPKMRLNNEAINLFLKRFVEENSSAIKNAVNKNGGDFKLKSIIDTYINIKSGYTDVKFSFSYKYRTEIPLIGSFSKTVRGTAKVRLDLKICKDNKNLALRFNRLKDLNVKGILESIVAKIFNAKDEVNKKMKGKIFGNTKLSYNTFNSSRVDDFLNVMLKDALKNKEIGSVKFKSVKFKSIDIVKTGQATLNAEIVCLSTNGSFDWIANLVLKTRDTSIWVETKKIQNLKFEKEIFSKSKTEKLERDLESEMKKKPQKICSVRDFELD